MLLEKNQVPPCGWNSYDAYGCAITEAEANAELDCFLKLLKPHGYEYFCIDAGWYCDGGGAAEAEAGGCGQLRKVNIDAYGRYIPSPVNFPHGLRAIADRCHAEGVKFGLHMMRGMPYEALVRNTPVKGMSSVRAADLYDADNNCPWSRYTIGIDMKKPGAQEYYDSVAEYLCDELAVDLVKFDDATERPEHVEAFAAALAKTDRRVLLSLSPGNSVWPGTWPRFARCADMARITADVWDRDTDNASKLERWYMMENCAQDKCRLDLDMIPFGMLQVNVPAAELSDPRVAALGVARKSHLTPYGKRTAMTIYALSGSPLIYGGALTLAEADDIALATDPEMLECNRNAVPAKRVFLERNLDVRKAPRKDDAAHGWLGVFNLAPQRRRAILSAAELGFKTLPVFHDIWGKFDVAPGDSLVLELEANACSFLRY